jgi:DNA-binding HxlR family transcriptional regulator
LGAACPPAGPSPRPTLVVPQQPCGRLVLNPYFQNCFDVTRQRSPAAPAAFCPVRDVLAGVLDRWSMLVVLTLHEEGRCRFGGLRERVPDVSPRMLSISLQRLQSARVVVRLSYAEAPPRVEYKLTPSGAALAQVLESAQAWAVKHGQG